MLVRFLSGCLVFFSRSEVDQFVTNSICIQKVELRSSTNFVSVIMLFDRLISKFQKQTFLFSFEPKNEQNYFFEFCPSQIKKVKALYYIN